MYFGEAFATRAVGPLEVKGADHALMPVNAQRGFAEISIAFDNSVLALGRGPFLKPRERDLEIVAIQDVIKESRRGSCKTSNRLKLLAVGVTLGVDKRLVRFATELNCDIPLDDAVKSPRGTASHKVNRRLVHAMAKMGFGSLLVKNLIDR
jgi:hypothetical protein